MKTFIIGDLHGAYKAFKQVIDRSGIDKQKDLLITLGDITDGHSETFECVEELLKFDNRIDIRGNHDQFFNEWLQTGINPDQWRQGGLATAKSYKKDLEYIKLSNAEGGYLCNINPDDIPDSHKKFFNKQILFYEDNETGRAFVHGGYTDDRGLGYDINYTYYWDRSLWEQRAMIPSQYPSRRLLVYKEIFLGHTTTMFWKDKGTNQFIDYPMNKHNVWNLDTGAGFKGRFTIMNVDTKEYWQSDRVEELYPLRHA